MDHRSDWPNQRAPCKRDLRFYSACENCQFRAKQLSQIGNAISFHITSFAIFPIFLQIRHCMAGPSLCESETQFRLVNCYQFFTLRLSDYLLAGSTITSNKSNNKLWCYLSIPSLHPSSLKTSTVCNYLKAPSLLLTNCFKLAYLVDRQFLISPARVKR